MFSSIPRVKLPWLISCVLILSGVGVALGVAKVSVDPATSPLAASDDGDLMHDIIQTPQMTPLPHTRIVWMQVTAYCPCPKCCGPHAMGVTASGKPVSYNAGRFIAADTTLLPFGSKVIVPGYDQTPVEVIDRGSAIKGNHIDVFFPTHEQAVHWGRQWIPVTVLD